MRPFTRYTLLICMLFAFSICSSCGGSSSGSDEGDSDDGDDSNGTDSAPLLADVNDYTYWLQDIDIDELAASGYDLVVIDYSSDGSDESAFTADEIQELKDAGMIVLAYMSIGEAEEGRFYFEDDWVDSDTKEILDTAPDFLAESNPDFPDNFKVRFWEEEWQNIIFGTPDGNDESYLDRIIDAGFDGVYLDIIDAFEFFGPDGEMPERPSAGEDMIDFVIAMADYARNDRGVENFLVFPQNGATILDEDGSDEYLEAADGIGAEDTFYIGDEDIDNDLDLDNADFITPYLDQFVDAGKTVLAVDYLTDPDKIDDFYERAQGRGYIPFCSTRDLDVLTVNAGHEPD
ncbi:MAG: endo alpha-1,4 polygalactosaminidase [Deltaproteobacteria bacterium]|nr:endo alpha-1,4 polygalactosaminidase [Deltaproteobacteria bacterium]